MNKQETEKIIAAGKILSQTREYAKKFIKKGMPLLEIAEKIETKIVELGGKPAFPTNLSINDIAAHYTPSYNDETLAEGLLKIDLGAHIDGWVADGAFSIDLENKEENKKLIKASEDALKNAVVSVKKQELVGKVGKIIQETIESQKASPIINLSGHSIEQYDLHSGVNIPNHASSEKTVFEEGIYAIEPFATYGSGRVYDGKPSGIYELIDLKNVRSPIARKVLDYVIEEYDHLPFCSRWLVKKFGTSALIGLKQLEENGNLMQFAQLVETTHKNVAQSEHTVLISGNKVIVTTE
ncbi:MAG TPA: type II methionyl aminopeptidase [Candidatus Pacearchaeota archaeon]|nr:type II methionyl aminopeptidase [Candidatus Pacearchaeota archaeon]